MTTDVEKRLASIEMKVEKLYKLVEERFLTLDEIERLISADELVKKNKLKELISVEDLIK